MPIRSKKRDALHSRRKVRIVSASVVVAVIALGGSLAYGYFLVAPNTGGFLGKLRNWSLQISEQAFSCHEQAKIGQRIFENQSLDSALAIPLSKEWFEMALSCSSPVALDHMGYFYIKGHGVDRNVEKGIAMLERAKKAGHSDAAKTLAREIYFEEDVAWDYIRAIENFEICAKQGDAYCKARLAELFAYHADQPDYFRAFELAESSAKAGEPRAQGILAWLYLYGRGVTKDSSLARLWAERALGNL